MLDTINPRLLLAIILTTNASLVGLGFVLLPERVFNRIKQYLFYLGTGILLGTVFLHALPELIEQKTPTLEFSTKLMLGGVLVAFLVEKISCWHHCHIPPQIIHKHSHRGEEHEKHSTTQQAPRKSLILTNLLGDSLHNLLHGFMLYNAYSISDSLGATLLLGILGHEIPGEIADMSILLHTGLSLRHAILINWLISLTTMLGTLLGIVPIPPAYILAVGTGILLYIALTDLLGELRHEHTRTIQTLKQLVLLLIGIGVMMVI